MSGYGGVSTSDSKNSSLSTSRFGQNVFGPQQGALQGLYANAAGMFQNNQRGMDQLTPGAAQYANQIASMGAGGLNSQLQGGAYQGINANDIYKQITGSMSQPSNSQQINNMIMGGAGNNYADAMKATYMRDADFAQKQMLNNLDSRASLAGLPGSSRQGIAAALGTRDINANLQSQMAQTGFNSFDKDLDRKLAIAGQADQATLARQGMLTDMLAGKQAAMSGGLNSASGIQGMAYGGQNAYLTPWQSMQQYANAIGGPTVLNSGSSYGTGKGSSNSFGMEAGGGLSVICTHMFNAGYLDEDTYKADSKFGETLRRDDPHVYTGYRIVADPIVSYLEKSDSLTKLMIPVVNGWSKEMLRRQGHAVKVNPIITLIVEIGMVILRAIGKRAV